MNCECDAWLWRYHVIKLSSVLLNLLKLTCNSSYLTTLTFVDNLSTTGTRGSSPANVLHPGPPRLPFLPFSPSGSRTSTCSTFPLRTWRAWNRFYGSWFPLFSCQKFDWKVGFLVGDICLLCKWNILNEHLRRWSLEPAEHILSLWWIFVQFLWTVGLVATEPHTTFILYFRNILRYNHLQHKMIDIVNKWRFFPVQNFFFSSHFNQLILFRGKIVMLPPPLS